MTHIELDLEERRQFYRLLEQNFSMSEIASTMRRHRSTLYREFRRNYWHDKEVPKASGYWPTTAQSLANERRQRQRKLIRYPQLLKEVVNRLKAGWSPEQIAGRLKIEKFAPLRVSHETIYKFIYSKDGRERSLGKLLSERHKKRRSRYARKARSHVFPDIVTMKNRPDAINRRQEFGHWEADLMIFRKEHGKANVATVVERQSRYTVLFKNNDRRSKPLMNKLISLFSPLPFAARQSITFDRGFEFVSWRELDKGMGTKAWFCDPSAPWQKGSVENMNKRIRRYLPRETPVLAMTNLSIRSICDILNATPRKCLGYRTPSEVFGEKLRNIQRATC